MSDYPIEAGPAQPVAIVSGGTSNIGDVDVLSLPALPVGTNKIGAVDIDFLADIKLGAKSCVITLAAGVGSAPLPATARWYGVKPATADIRIGLEAPEADGTATGAAASANMKNGVPVYRTDDITWFAAGTSTVDRTVYFRSTVAAQTLEYVYM